MDIVGVNRALRRRFKNDCPSNNHGSVKHEPLRDNGFAQNLVIFHWTTITKESVRSRNHSENVRLLGRMTGLQVWIVCNINVFCYTPVKRAKLMPHTCYFDNIPIAVSLGWNSTTLRSPRNSCTLTASRLEAVLSFQFDCIYFLIVLCLFFPSLPGHLFLGRGLWLVHDTSTVLALNIFSILVWNCNDSCHKLEGLKNVLGCKWLRFACKKSATVWYCFERFDCIHQHSNSSSFTVIYPPGN